MKKIVLSFIAILSISILTNCEKDTNENVSKFQLEQADYIPDIEYEIYSLVSNKYFSSNQIVISQRTNQNMYFPADGVTDYMKFENISIDTTMLENYKYANDTTFRFDNKFVSDEKEIILISNTELQHIFNDHSLENNWNKFHKEYPYSKGLISFTRIGFNDSRTQAVFEISHQYAGLGGSGSIVFLKKEKGNWIIIGKTNTWIS